ncbi:arf-GAP domain and FG repeat-containing protein 1 isoform X3 [Anopheles gambiae]|uniref:arf-GAP domain and FG repeat-containing protein 1 isoform X3 n=1 Tax=Anopheles gambiae TaxID=7165 RepID=UPI002AC9D729|nr:arf-GAP domain and FG repeat-containing protein 1 isoform X3 [Anopheles gambiae]XP_061516491.1 arf-GAP domain and FG repeat-containing protein 1 isoform X3 [Anopheles gambiae]XP_061516492.1 arf-GAP domain and FG repeat-containing protein 1 isoform X3 [Anopheles gambiae]XP_061516494.1 arf-GAP domain and FG repeat-containing protein 1 isoform X3 [Anopheles gambiae]
MALVRKKLDDKILKTLRELVGVGGNKECFDCGQKGPTYINMTIGSFVCTSCSGILRGLTPPHRVKSISMATFTQEEIEFLKQNGNDNCSRTWLGLWDPKRAIKQEHRDFMIDKYERKRYYLEPASPLKSLPTNASSSLTSLSGGSNKNANESLVPLKTPTLTPPATLRLNRTNSGSCNGLNNVNASSSSLPGAIGGGTQFQQQFTPDDSGFFSADPPKILPPTPQKSHILQRKNGIKMKQHPANGLPATYGRNQKNGLLNNSSAAGLSGSSGDINANKFTPDADFVADFGSATIVNNVSNGGSHYGSTSSLKNSNAVSDNGTGLYAQHNGNNGEVSAREMENFADFDHNPIFNSAGLPMLHGTNNGDSKTSNGKPSNASINSTPSVDRYAALKDLDEQFREIKLEQQAEANNNTITSNGTATTISDSITPTSSANPFKTANPFQPQQQQPHAQQQTMAWPISGAINGTTPDARHPVTNGGTGFYATSPYQGGFAHSASPQLYNGNVVNGGSTMGATMGYLPAMGYPPNHGNNGYPGAQGMNGVMMGGQFNVTANGGGASILGNVAGVGNPVHHFANFGNPFMAAGTTAGNSNNPFL